MAFKLRSGNSGAFKALKKVQLWKPPGSEDESNNTVDNSVDNDVDSSIEETESSGEDNEARTTARTSDIALNQLISPREQRKGGLENPRIRRRAEVRGQRYNQAVDSEMGVEGVEGPEDFKKGFKEGSAIEAWGVGGFGSGMPGFFKKKKYDKK